MQLALTDSKLGGNSWYYPGGASITVMLFCIKSSLNVLALLKWSNFHQLHKEIFPSLRWVWDLAQLQYLPCKNIFWINVCAWKQTAVLALLPTVFLHKRSVAVSGSQTPNPLGPFYWYNLWVLQCFKSVHAVQCMCGHRKTRHESGHTI